MKEVNNVIKTYAAKTKNKDIQSNSQSGGMFTALSDFVLSQNGVIYGCKLDKNFKAIHDRADTKEERNFMRGSKYVQSDTTKIFKMIKGDLESQKKVLFVGTPCQVANVKGYLDFLKVDIKNLYLVDIVCHGVPSPGVWNKYLEYLEGKNGKIKKVNFRNKKFGWESSVSTFETENKVIKNYTYTTMFYKHYIVRPSCFECPYRNINRVGDVTIGDCWGIKEKNKELYDKNGVSILLINNNKGLQIFNEIKEKLIFNEIDIHDYLQQAFKNNYNEPKNILKFKDDYKNKKFKYIAQKYGADNMEFKIKKIIKKCLKVIGD